MLTYLPNLLAFMAFALAAFVAFRQESREDGQTTAQRLRKTETALVASDIRHANQEARQQGFQTEIENVADYGKRERQTMEANFRRDYEALKDLIKDVPVMRDLLSRMDERFINTGKELDKMSRDMAQIIGLLTHK